MEIDKEKIKKRFSEINEALEEIRKLVLLSDEEFWSKKEYMAAVKYYLLQAIEAIGSVCVHIAAKRFNKGVSSFGECFEIMEKEGLLEESLTARLRKMVKFRNRLTHKYWEVDDKNILNYTREDLGDFEEFIRAINVLL
ncbi:MAG: DUF86 domain-containing protein [Candidatus Portnoybacteria bacterium]|nr:DUF86 domain-containing protein [Candidatus Portnoybacteria bacterium]